MSQRLGQNEISVLIERVVCNDVLSQSQVHEPFPAQGLQLNYMIILSPSHLINSVRRPDAVLCMQDPYWLLPFFPPWALCVSWTCVALQCLGCSRAWQQPKKPKPAQKPHSNGTQLFNSLKKWKSGHPMLSQNK